jgi:hypothetical protein
MQGLIPIRQNDKKLSDLNLRQWFYLAITGTGTTRK